MSEDGHQRLLQEPVLVLNATYEPINVTAVRRAIVLVLKGVATAEEENGAFLHAADFAIRIPSVIRLADSGASRTRRAPCLERTSCCVTVTPASFVAGCSPRTN